MAARQEADIASVLEQHKFLIGNVQHEAICLFALCGRVMESNEDIVFGGNCKFYKWLKEQRDRLGLA